MAKKQPPSREYTFEDVLNRGRAAAFNSVLSRDTQEDTQEEEAPPEKTGFIEGMFDAGWQGVKSAGRSIMATGNTVAGDLEDVELLSKAQSLDAKKYPAEYQALMATIEERKKANPDATVWQGVKDTASAAADNKTGVAQMVAANLPNTAAAMGGGWAGAKVGAMGGAALGSFIPGVGTAVGGVAGGLLGGLSGMFLGNFALEAGGKAIDKAGDGFTQQEADAALTEGEKKAAVITGVDALTLGAGKLATHAFSGAAIQAGARAEAKVLADAGVDITNGAKITQALANAELRNAAKAAGEAAAKAASTTTRRAGNAATGLTMETVGEGTGEYWGEELATGQGNVYDAALESVASLSQSGLQTAQAMRESGGNNLDPRGILKAQLADQTLKGNSPLSRATTAANPDLKTDPFTQRATEVEALVRDGGLLQKLREIGPQHVDGFLYAFQVARDQNAPAAARQAAIDTLNTGLDWIAKGSTSEAPGTGSPYSTELTVPPGETPVGGDLTTPGMPPAFDPNTVDGEARRTDNIPQLPNNPSPNLSGFFDGGDPNGVLGDPTRPDSGGPGGQPVDTGSGLGAGDGGAAGPATDGLRPPADDLGAVAGDTGAAVDTALNRTPPANVDGAPAEINSAGPAELLAGEKINNTWTAFHPESGTLNVPREQMPQIASEHRGAMVNFLQAKGVGHEADVVEAASLKPTQDKFSPAKVKQAQAFDGTDRPVLVSSDGYVLDGHHQWLAKAQDDNPVKVLRLNAPIKDLLNLMQTFPSAGMTKPKEQTSKAPDVVTSDQTQQGQSQAPQAPAAPVARTQVAAPQTIAAAPASKDNTGTAQLRKRRAQLAHMADGGFTQLQERDGVTYMVNEAKNAEMPLGSSVDVALARQAVVKAGGTGDTVRQTNGVRDGENQTAAGTGNRGRVHQATRENDSKLGGSGDSSAPSGVQRTELSQGAAPGIVPNRQREQAAVAELQRAAPDVAPADPGDPRVRSLKALLAVFAKFSGVSGIAIDDAQSDGIAYRGNIFISINNPHMHVAWTIGHEFAHFSERYPGIKALHDSIWALIDNEAGKRDYYHYLAKNNESFRGTTYDTASIEQLEGLKQEMVADFLGKRLFDKAWLESIAKKKPNVFGQFVKDWIPLLGSIIQTLKGVRDKMTGVKNIDQYISKLQEAKDIAEQVMEIWAKERPGYAQRTEMQLSAKEVDMSDDFDLDFMDELQAELQDELQAELQDELNAPDVQDYGLAAEDAFPDLLFKKQHGNLVVNIPDLYREGRMGVIQLDSEEDNLWGSQFVGTWIGPANTEKTGYVTLKAAKAFARRFVASSDLRARGFDLNSAVTPAQKDAVVSAWKDYNARDDVRKYPVVNDTLPVKAIAAKMGLTQAYDIKADTEVLSDAERTLVMTFTNKANGNEQMAIMSLNLVDGKWLGTANTSSLERGGLGSAVYQLMTEYAAARDITIHPDNSLSGINTYRRTEQMLSAAMRTGKSNVMVPHPTQRIYGFNNEASTPEEHDDNLARMLLAGLRNVRELAPKMDSLVYNPETGVFTDKKGKSKEVDVRKMLEDTDARAFGLGRSTLARAVLTRMAMSGDAVPASSFKEPVLYSAKDAAATEYQVVIDRYKGTDAWMKAPNGKRSNLNERQWVQTRTPSFLSWFGDWTQGNIWDRDDVSKAVDENGEPLVVYHGTDNGGFYAFKQPGGERRGDLGIFTTSNRAMAMSYVRRGRAKDITPPETQKDLENLGYEFEEGFRISEKFYDNEDDAKDDQDDGDVIVPAVRVTDTDGYTMDGPRESGYLFASMDQAIQKAMENFDGAEGVSTVYAAFLNLRNPNEEDFEGALWSGSREHQWTVVVGGEIQTDADGTQYFDEDEAREFAKTFADPDDEDEGADYMVAADDHWLTTDEVVREGRGNSSDGAIIRQVVDDGGGTGYDDKPSDVFVAFEPNQLKSADWNTGEFGLSDDLRFSAKHAENPRRDIGVHVLGIARGERVTSNEVVMSEEEMVAIQKAAVLAKMPLDEVEQMVRDAKAAHPASDNWAPVVFVRAKKNEDTGKVSMEYKNTPYSFNQDENGKPLKPGTAAYDAAIKAMSEGMLDQVRSVFERAKNGDKAAANIIAQSGWYKEMRTRLRQEFGGLGDLFADLLGATSPNTPVRDNWNGAIEALTLATKGDFDALLPKWIEWTERVQAAENEFKAFFDAQRKDGFSKKAIYDMPEYIALQEKTSAIRAINDELIPRKSNGAKFGFNGKNVIKAMVDLWRVVKNADPDIKRGGTAPKAINFSGNLIGFRSRATIDVWAARMLQRLAGGIRIPSMNEMGVTGEALEDGSNTLQFGFGQDVFEKAANLIRRDLDMSESEVLRTINEDDLQALVWFIEKEVWTLNNWTSAAGEGGSFEFEADLAGVDDKATIKALRKIADSSMAASPTQIAKAEADIARLYVEMTQLPDIAKAQAVLDRNAEIMKGLPKPKGAEADRIRTENKLAKAARALAKKSNAYHALELAVAKAERVLKKPTTEQRQAMRQEAMNKLGTMVRPVDRYTAGLSIQQGSQQGVPARAPTDAEMAMLADTIKDAIATKDAGATVIAIKAMATEGRYGDPERSLDLEVITTEGFDARPMAVAVFKAADDANQEAAFVARVLRPDEKFDPLLHRPGVELYFRDMNQAEEAMRIMGAIAGQRTRVVSDVGPSFVDGLNRVGKAINVGPSFFEVGGYTIIVDGKPSAATKAGAMGKPVGMRVLYLPEFELLYGIDSRLENATDEELSAIIKERAKDLRNFVEQIANAFEGVSFGGRFNYEVDTRFTGEYQGAIDEYESRNGLAGGGDSQRHSRSWQGRTSREALTAAARRLSLNASESGAKVSGGDQAQDNAKPQFSTRTPRPDSGPRASESRKVAGAVHYGNQAGLSILSGASNGTGIKGAEDQRVKESTDPRIKKRVYFYSPVEGGIPEPETGLGGAVYQADLDGIYDPRVVTKVISGSGNALESALLDAGYDGYMDPESGVIVMLGQDIPVKHLGQIGDFKLVRRVATRYIPKNTTRTEGNELVRKPEGPEMMQLVNPKKQAKIREAAPSFKMEYGYLRVKATEADAADQAIAEFSPTFRFNEVQFSVKSNTPELLPNSNKDAEQPANIKIKRKDWSNVKVKVPSSDPTKTLSMPIAPTLDNFDERTANMKRLLACL